MNENDPRVFFASERTLLAWVRTAIGLIGLGFVVARFGLFLRLVRSHDADAGQHISSVVLGVALALAGAAVAAVATWQNHRFVRTLGASELPARYAIGMAPILGAFIAVAGVVLAVELLL